MHLVCQLIANLTNRKRQEIGSLLVGHTDTQTHTADREGERLMNRCTESEGSKQLNSDRSIPVWFRVVFVSACVLVTLGGTGCECECRCCSLTLNSIYSSIGCA